MARRNRYMVRYKTFNGIHARVIESFSLRGVTREISCGWILDIVQL